MFDVVKPICFIENAVAKHPAAHNLRIGFVDHCRCHALFMTVHVWGCGLCAMVKNVKPPRLEQSRDGLKQNVQLVGREKTEEIEVANDSLKAPVYFFERNDH